MRLFVALDLPEPAVAALLAWRTPLLRGRDWLRPVPRASLHVTLAFLGTLGEDAVAPLSALVAAVAHEAGRGPELALDAGVWLPRRRPRVLAVGVADRTGGLARLQAGLAASLADGGWYAPEARPYLPHVTVARVRGRAAAPGEETLPPLPERSFGGQAVTLYRSLLDPAGARYEPLSRSRLG